MCDLEDRHNEFKATIDTIKGHSFEANHLRVSNKCCADD